MSYGTLVYALAWIGFGMILASLALDVYSFFAGRRTSIHDEATQPKIYGGVTGTEPEPAVNRWPKNFGGSIPPAAKEG